jgi:hypothetical protein
MNRTHEQVVVDAGPTYYRAPRRFNPYFAIVVALPVLVLCYFLYQFITWLAHNAPTIWAANWWWMVIVALGAMTPLWWKGYVTVTKHRTDDAMKNAVAQLLQSANERGDNVKFSLLEGEMSIEIVNAETARIAGSKTYVQEIVAPQVAQLETAVTPTQYELPPIEKFYDLIPYNSLQTGLGINAETGQPIITEILKSTHFKFIGGSDTGKSCLAAATLDIATKTNDREHLQIGLLDLEHKTSRLFENLPHVAELGPRKIRLIGRDSDEVASRIGLLKQELDRRTRLTEEEVQKEPVLLVYIEEMLSLKYEVEDEKLKKQMLSDINILGVRARKYRIYLLVVMQIDYSDKSTREAMAMFRTRGGFALDPTAARASGFHSTDLVTQNYKVSKQGQYVLEKPAFSGLVLAPYYDLKKRLAVPGDTQFATMGSTTTPTIVDSFASTDNLYSEAEYDRPTTDSLQAILAGLTQQEKRILTKWRKGISVSQIIESEFTNSKGEPLKGGNLFTQKAAEIQMLIGRFIPEQEEIL